jgi:hypothetical protein
MFRSILFAAGIAIAGLPSAGGTVHAQETPAGPQASPKEWLAERQAEFAAYEFTLESAQPRKLTLESRSLLNWSNAERGADVGAVFLWTDKGRPQLIACAFGREKLRHEFHSLGTEPIAAARGGEAVHRFQPGLAWQEFPAAQPAEAAPPPAKQRALRLSQMRRQAERFRVVMGGKNPVEMRLLTQPVFRTPAELKDDVALFVFVQGTDPECVLLVEGTAEDKWQYALTRQTKWPLKVELDGTQVAEFPSLFRTPPESPFVVLTPPSAKE